jgi:hypothetical protein
MARPLKNNADYFTHDAVMRNHRKVKALRNRFKSDGYSFWCMILELLTESDNFQIGINDQELELISCDFDMPMDTLKSLIDYCVKLELLQLQNDILSCSHLRNRFSGLLEKRQKNQDRYIKYKSNTVSAVGNSAETHENEVSAVDNDIVKESKVKESKVKYNTPLPPEGGLPGMEIPPLPPIGKKPKSSKHETEIVIPESLSGIEKFSDSWVQWIAYRKDRKLSTQTMTMQKQLEFLSIQPDPVGCINQSIMNGWQGLFELKGNRNNFNIAISEDDSPSAELRRAGILPPRPPKLTEEQRAALGLPQE